MNTSVMNSRNAVCVIVHDKDSGTVAAVHYAARNWSPQPAWTLPGGKAEPGEALDEAAIRELNEPPRVRQRSQIVVVTWGFVDSM
ncbi:NUDIX hydrolase [Streptomyces sp. ML-6]|uniref:NUDIX hydrolase n=1 Tax=Streptomyces sp. ML-6 TaxID=2982693 RepID=UPI0024BFB7CF|nr:NUDIX hydrolase [Streptomyces sp. ML-6]MDK0520543.1 NUDIX hydrolase [Streptomyces sp. ML-6]